MMNEHVRKPNTKVEKKNEIRHNIENKSFPTLNSLSSEQGGGGAST